MAFHARIPYFWPTLPLLVFMAKRQNLKFIHLGLSAFIVISVSIIYGGNFNILLPYFFGIEVHALNLKNMLRALMGLYIAFGLFWAYGLINPSYWRSATISNVLFMGGLAVGRIISTIFDGVTNQFMVALVLEIIFFILGIYLLNKDDSQVISSDQNIKKQI